MKNKSPLNRKTRLAFGSAVLILLVAGVTSYSDMIIPGERVRRVGSGFAAVRYQATPCCETFEESC